MSVTYRQLFHRHILYCLECILCLTIVFVHPPSEATVVKFASVQSLTEQADCIIQAQVLRQWTEVSKDTDQRIYTYTHLQVKDRWKGHTANLIQVRQLGGQVGELSLHVTGNASFKPQQQVVLFLKYDATSNLYFIISLAQGVFYISDITETQTNSSIRIYQELNDLTFYTQLIDLSHEHHQGKQMQSIAFLHDLKQKVLHHSQLPSKKVIKRAVTRNTLYKKVPQKRVMRRSTHVQ